MFRAINWAGIISLVRFLNKFLPCVICNTKKEGKGLARVMIFQFQRERLRLMFYFILRFRCIAGKNSMKFEESIIKSIR